MREMKAFINQIDLPNRVPKVIDNYITELIN